MQKDFDAWNENKKRIDAKEEERLFFKQGEVWWVAFGLNVGFEMNGRGAEYTRPAIILKKYNQYSFLALPLSTSKIVNEYRIPVGLIAGKDAVANLSQMRNIDSKRLVKKICFIDRVLFEGIKKKASHVNFG